jgi:heme-degrading monooxygenase HmoA
MFARINTFEGSPQDLDASIADVREQVVPACERIPGFEGMVLLVDRSSGKSVGITFWESEAALTASEQRAGEIRGSSAQRQNERIVSVERFEVPLSTLKARAAAR